MLDRISAALASTICFFLAAFAAVAADASHPSPASTNLFAAKKTHWAYLKPVRPELSKVKHTRWPRNPIDAFILARLEKENLAPSPEADRPTLIPRLSLDLTGLPPTLAEVAASVADNSNDASAK